MAENTSAGGFAGDPAAALSVAGTGGCCGNPAQATLTLPEVSESAGPCCGRAEQAATEQSCCGSAAKGEAIKTGRGCCG